MNSKQTILALTMIHTLINYNWFIIRNDQIVNFFYLNGPLCAPLFVVSDLQSSLQHSAAFK
jgi:hypothetical protein